MTPLTQANCICQFTTSKLRISRLALRGFQAHPSIDIMILVYSHILTHWTRVETVYFFWFYGCVWSPPYAKCRVCEDMQVARCLCNFPPAPFKRQAPFERQARCARCNNNEHISIRKSNSAWLEFQRFFA